MSKPCLIALMSVGMVLVSSVVLATMEYKVSAHQSKEHEVSGTKVYVEGDGTNIDCFLYDSKGDMIDSDDNLQDHCFLENKKGGKLRLVVVNEGNRESVYVITNR